MSYIFLWVLNVHAPSEEKIDYSKSSFYEELEQVCNCFPKWHAKPRLGDCGAKVGRENIFKPAIGNDSLHEDSNINGVRIVTFDTSKNLVDKSSMFPNRNIHTYTWTSPDEKTHNQKDLILTDMIWHSSIPDVRCFRGADWDTDHYLVVAKVRERLAASKQESRNSDVGRFNFGKLNELEVWKQYQIKVSKRFVTWENLSDSDGIKKGLGEHKGEYQNLS